ncbi:unnamed protein product [Adineta steineri]|uniref:HP domain-containing protein n=1 Tax=Adineta steineri TaxID=433720 RepID=A0A814RAI4_9BILA|nr:unnamed protein product [Adineta steineri]
MSSSDLSYDTYRVCRLNDHDLITPRSKNVAKVEPYSINTITNRPHYQSSSALQSIPMTTATTTAAVPSKTRISHNSIENVQTNLSTSSSIASHGGIIRHPNVHHSDFLMPYPIPSLQPLSNSSSYTTPSKLLSDSHSYGSLQQLPTINSSLYNGRNTDFISSKNNSPQSYSTSMQSDLHSNTNILNNNNNSNVSTSYHYRPSPTANMNNGRSKLELPIHSTIFEQQQQDESMNSGQQNQSRRRFQRRKQMKRSKSVDLYQEQTSSFISPIINNEFNKSSRQPKSISREHLAKEEDFSSSSSSSSLTTDIERVNRAALLRYKSLDSMTFNNQKSNFNGRLLNNNNTNNNHRRSMHKPKEYDFDSDDSVCGIPKPRKLCTSSKNTAKSEGTLLHSSTLERDRRNSVQAISNHTIGSSGTHTGITNAIRKNETTTDPMVESFSSAKNTILIPTNGEREGEDIIQPTKSGISFVEPQFYARSSNIPQPKRSDFVSKKAEEFYSSPKPILDDFKNNKDQIIINDKVIPRKWNNEEKPIQTQELFINESGNSPLNKQKLQPISNTIIVNSNEYHRPNKQYQPEDVSLQIFDQFSFPSSNQNELPRKTSIESITLNQSLKSSMDQIDETNDSSTSTSRSVHLPVEKQRGLSEIIRKRNSRCKVEDYKRSIQKSSTFDEQQMLPSLSKSEQELTSTSDMNSKNINQTYLYDIPINFQANTENQVQRSIERLNVLLSNEELRDMTNETDEKSSVADKKNLFETIIKDTPIGGTLPRTRSIKNDDSSLKIKKSTNENQSSEKENILVTPQQTNEDLQEKKPEDATYDDDISKLSFKEKMILFNKKKNLGGLPSSKPTRSRLTQPITAEEVQAAANLTPSSSTKELAVAYPEDAKIESENVIPVSKRLEQIKTFGETEWIKSVKPSEKLPAPVDVQKSTRKTPTLKYNAKKTNTDQQQRAKTVDIVRLRTDSTIKSKDTNQTSLSTKNTNGTTTTKSNNNNVLSVLKSDTISVLKPDDHLDDFFTNITKNLNEELSVQLNTDDLNRIAENTVRLQSQAPRVRPPRRQQQGAKNPLRQIQANIPTENEYTEIHTNVSEQEVRRIKRAQIAENAGVAQEALAALTAGENFAEVNLRKIDQTPVAKFGYEPYKEIMLILIKGRRQCSLRLVNPMYESINEGDCYLLITPLKVFAWLGRYANTLEKARATDIIDYLRQHRDFGLRNEVKYFILDQAKDDTEDDSHAEFRDMLQGEIDDYKLINDVTDDDFYETNIIDLNRVYRVENDLLLPLENFCFRSLSIKILDPNEVFVFDFGSELYVWNGKFADKIKRNMGLQLAQQLWNDSYDYSESIINPYNPFDDENEEIDQSGGNRPAWCIFGKQNQNVETLLFKGKFYDWPNDLQEIKPVNDVTNNIKIPSTQRPRSILETLKPADVHNMLAKQDTPVNFIVEQISLGRGRHWYDPVEMRGHDIETISLNVWHVSENERHELSKSSYGQFYSDDVYIIQWKYKLLPSANNKTSGQKIDTARTRIAYWIWQGINANANEKGISALMTVCFEEEKGPHIHVAQEHEEAAFLQLFDGTLTIHIGKRNQLNEKKSNWHLYIFLGEIDVETHWWELNVTSANLRSRTSFLLINNSENLMLLWHGYETTDEQQNLASRSAMKLRERCPEEFHFDGDSEDVEFFEMQEGDEIELFWEGINERNHERKYYSLLNAPSNTELISTMRIFHLSSLHGPFVAQELLYPLRSPDHISPFPFTQSDLYELHQPALCLIDTNTELYIWQGWNDQLHDELGSPTSNNNLVVRGTKDIRFTTERRCAFLTAVDYYKTKTGSSTVNLSCSIIYAGLEPIDFINLFPKWSVHIKARQQNQLEGKKLNQKDSVIDVLNQLCRDQYSIEELRTRPLPEGVDPSKIESYLSETDFQKQFHMSKDEFYALPYWKQTNIKKPLGFF